MKNEFLHLLPVLEHEEQVQAIIEESLSYFDTNVKGPLIYCTMYQNYNYILIGEAKKNLMEFFKQEFFPPLKVRKLLVIV